MRITVVLLAFLTSGAIVFAEAAPRVLFLSMRDGSPSLHYPRLWTVSKDGEMPVKIEPSNLPANRLLSGQHWPSVRCFLHLLVVAVCFGCLWL